MKFLIITRKRLMLGISVILATVITVLGSVITFANSDRLLHLLCRNRKETGCYQF